MAPRRPNLTDGRATPFWGQTGHYTIAATAIDVVSDPDLRALLQANNGNFVDLADVPDLVWKKTPHHVRGGRDLAPNSGPEHPNHYADIDAPDASGGPTLGQVTLAPGNPSAMQVQVWNDWYIRNGKTDWNQQGVLPFRVWQIFTLMLKCLAAGDVERFVCAAGVVSHYVGDACQPLHGSYHADGYRERGDPQARDWPGRGVHSTYEDRLIDRYSAQLHTAIGQQAVEFTGTVPPIANGQDAALATVHLMDYVARVIPPTELCDEYIRLGGGTSHDVVDGLWNVFGPRTGQVMGAGARYLAALWDAAFATVSHPALPAVAVGEAKLAAIYEDVDFAPSRTLDQIESKL